MELEQWEDAFAMKRLHPDLEDDVTLPYAQWLIHHDRFDHARIAYSHAGRPDLSGKLLKQLTENAVRRCYTVLLIPVQMNRCFFLMGVLSFHRLFAGGKWLTKSVFYECIS